MASEAGERTDKLDRSVRFVLVSRHSLFPFTVSPFDFAS